MFSSRASCDAANVPGWWRSPPTPPRNLCPTMPKARPQTGKPPHRETHPGSDSGGGRQRQSPHHPRLWENHKRSLIGGPRKMGGPGGGRHWGRAGAAGSVPLRPPLVPLWLLSGHPERSSPPQRRNSPTRRASATPPSPSVVDRERKWGSPPAPPGAQPTLQGGGGHHLPRPTAQLVPHNTKGASSSGGTTMQGKSPRQRQRWGRQRQSPHHPRLWENHKRSLIGGPRKMGGPGGGRHWGRAGAAGSVPLRPPPVPLWLLSGHPERSSPPGRRNSPSPAPQAPTPPTAETRAHWGEISIKCMQPSHNRTTSSFF